MRMREDSSEGQTIFILGDPAEVSETEILECDEGDDTANQIEETGHNGVSQDVGNGGAHLGLVFGHLLSSEEKDFIIRNIRFSSDFQYRTNSIVSVATIFREW